MIFRVTFIVCLVFFNPFNIVLADNNTIDAISENSTSQIETSPPDSNNNQTSLKMLNSILKVKKGLNSRIIEKSEILDKSSSVTEKNHLKSELEKLDQQTISSSIQKDEFWRNIIDMFSKLPHLHSDLSTLFHKIGVFTKIEFFFFEWRTKPTANFHE